MVGYRSEYRYSRSEKQRIQEESRESEHKKKRRTEKQERQVRMRAAKKHIDRRIPVEQQAVQKKKSEYQKKETQRHR